MSNGNPLLNKESVQGAAKTIEGLMDSNGVINKSTKEAAPVEPEETTEVESEVEQKPEAQLDETQEVDEEDKHQKMKMQLKKSTDLHQLQLW